MKVWSLFGTEDGIVHVWSVDSRIIVQTFTDLTGSVTTVAWSPDSKRIAASTGEQNGKSRFGT